MLSAGVIIIAACLTFNYEALVSKVTLWWQQRQWKLKLGDLVIRSDLPIPVTDLVTEIGEAAYLMTGHPKGLTPVHYKHHLHWLHLNPSGHVHYKKGTECALSESVPGEFPESPTKHCHADGDYADSVHVWNLVQEFPHLICGGLIKICNEIFTCLPERKKRQYSNFSDRLYYTR